MSFCAKSEAGKKTDVQQINKVPSHKFVSAEELRRAIRCWDMRRLMETWGDPSSWDVSAITDMSYLFANSMFPYNISAWDVSNVTNMSHMFHGAHVPSSIRNWNVSRVTDMSYTFFNAMFDYRRLIFRWDTSNVLDMSYMFTGSDFDGYIADFDVGRVRNMEFIFFRSQFSGWLNRWTPHQLERVRKDALDHDIIFQPKIIRLIGGDYSAWNEYVMKQIVWVERITRDRLPDDVVRHIKTYVCGAV